MERKKYRTKVGRRSPGRPKRSEQKELNTETEILKHAESLFLTSGYAAVSISNITESVGVTKPTLYHYFPDKEHLYTAVLCNCLERTGKQIVRAIQEDDSLQRKLIELASIFFYYAPLSVSSWKRDVDAHLSPSLVQQIDERYQLSIINPHLKLLEKAMNRGEIAYNPGHLPIFTDLWISLLDGIYVSHYQGRKWQQQEINTNALEVVVQVFLNGIIQYKKKDEK